MAPHVEGTFKLSGWNEDTYDKLEGEAKLTKARIEQEFSGELEAKGVWESLMCYREDGTAEFVGFERLVGKIGDRSGSFVVRAIGTFDGNEARMEWTIVEGSGTEDLGGIKGTGGSAAPHGPNGTYTLDYEL